MSTRRYICAAGFMCCRIVPRMSGWRYVFPSAGRRTAAQLSTRNMGQSGIRLWRRWRYKRKEDYWIPSNSITRDFIVSGNSNLSVSSLYRFNIGTASAPIISATGVGSVTTYQQSGNTHFNIPNVSENPLIIKFQ